jgi:hypothetical protein
MEVRNSTYFGGDTILSTTLSILKFWVEAIRLLKNKAYYSQKI